MTYEEVKVNGMEFDIKISVIVPVYNVEKYLEKCIESIINQTFEKYEIILVDDGSTDSSCEIVDYYGEKYPQIINVFHKKNGGLGDARNYGINHAKGEYLIFIDSDDYIELDMLECLYNKAKEYNSDIVMCRFKSITESGNIKYISKEKFSEDELMTLSKNKDLMLTHPAAWNKMYRRELFLSNNDIRYPSQVWYEDIRTTLKLFNVANSIIYVDKVLYNYLIREGSITNNKNCERNSEIVDALNDIVYYFKSNNKYEEYKEEIEYLTIFHVYITASVRVLMIDDKSSLINYLRSFLYTNFPDWTKNKYIKNLDANKKIILSLLNKKQYWLIKIIFTLKKYMRK